MHSYFYIILTFAIKILHSQKYRFASYADDLLPPQLVLFPQKKMKSSIWNSLSSWLFCISYRKQHP